MAFDFILNNSEFFIFVAFLAAFLIYKRKNIEIQGIFPLFYFVLYKTSLGLKNMKSWSANHPRTFLYLSYFSIFIGIFGMIATFIFMFWQLGFIVENDLSQGGGFVLPLKTDNGMDGAVPIFFVPFWYWIIGLFVLVLVHEFAHGVIAERFGIRIKSSGFAFLGLLLPLVPAAFVEPDQNDLKKKKWWQQIAVFGAGSTSNFIFGGMFLLLWIFAAIPLVNNTMTVGNISFNSVINESDLKQYNVRAAEIVALNGIENKSLIVEELTQLSVNETLILTLRTDGEINNYTINTFENPNIEGRGMIGISGLQFGYSNVENYEFVGNSPLYFERLLFYLWFLNIGIGIMNLLPLWITDGGQIARTMLLRYFRKENALKLYSLISFISLFLIIFTIRPSLLISIIGWF